MARGPQRCGWNRRMGFQGDVDAPWVYYGVGWGLLLPNGTHMDCGQLGTRGSPQGKERGPGSTVRTGHGPPAVGDGLGSERAPGPQGQVDGEHAAQVTVGRALGSSDGDVGGRSSLNGH